ncbi:hypothetical protein THAOC_21370 [Thalassiosira oceanica]|uniref:Uncharacterized protein n=1 Tax=Thalassiosira oceanica TaxID=159749 RepID=K0RXH5_THAOC|nr:hypothetical protein THAOC_21370 [Thalassiosira oceanica]|eukprot:EJK58498.1 hypothetical protein THAOC_21370 [Thalassiosira oceanica]
MAVDPSIANGHRLSMAERPPGLQGMSSMVTLSSGQLVTERANGAATSAWEAVGPSTDVESESTSRDSLAGKRSEGLTQTDRTNFLGFSSAGTFKSTMPYLEEVLSSNIPVLLYAGDYNYICNYLGVLAVARALDWEHAADFNSAEDHDWEDGRGKARSADKLSFLRTIFTGRQEVRTLFPLNLLTFTSRAGHMVPTDQPASSLK